MASEDLIDFRGGGHKVPRFNLRALNCILSLKFGVCIESYVQQTKIKKKFKKILKQPRNQIFEKISQIFCHHENVRHSAKTQNFELQFFANILILIVLIDSTKKTLGYRGSCGVTFENLEFFRFLRGPNGGFPKKIFNSFFTRNCLTPKY